MNQGTIKTSINFKHLTLWDGEWVMRLTEPTISRERAQGSTRNKHPTGTL